MNVPEVGQRWKKAREECGLSVRAAAKLIGIHYNTIYDLEKGDDGVTLRLMRRAADEYGVSLGYIFGMDDPRPERVPVYLRPLMEPLEPLTRTARESIVRNIASNLRFMSMLYGGAAADNSRPGGSISSITNSTMPEPNSKQTDTLRDYGVAGEGESGSRGAGANTGEAGRTQRGQHRKAARQGAGHRKG